MIPPYIPCLSTSALPTYRITQPKVPQHSTQGSSTLNPQLHGILDSNMRPWFKNASAYSTSTCLSHSNMHISHSKMLKRPVRAENSFPEAQILYVERFLRDIFNAPCHGSVCGGGRHQNRVPIFFYVCFYGNGPLEPRFSTQTLIFCVCRDLGEMCLTYQATWAGVPPPKNRCWSSQKQTENTRKCVCGSMFLCFCVLSGIIGLQCFHATPS